MRGSFAAMSMTRDAVPTISAGAIGINSAARNTWLRIAMHQRVTGGVEGLASTLEKLKGRVPDEPGDA